MASTQQQHPWRAALRTAVEVGIPAFGVALVVLPQVFQILAAELGTVLPESWTAWLLGAAGVVTLVSGALARIAAIPRVDRFLAKFGLGSKPKHLQE